MHNQEDIICKVYGMDFRELLDLIIENPFFLTENYLVAIREAVQTRYAELTANVRAYYSF
jgi:flagellar assembly factor FliW